MKENSITNLFECSKNDSIDKDFHNFYMKTLKDLPSKKRFNKLVGIAASFVLIAILSIYTVTFAGNAPIIKDIKNYFYAPNEYKKYSKSINSTLEFNNYTVSIQDIVYDNNFLIYTYTINRNDGSPIKTDEESKLNADAIIDIKNKPGYVGGIFNREANNDGSITYVKYYVIKNLNLPDKINLKINAKYEGKTKKTIGLEIDKSKLNPSYKEITLNKEIKVPEGTIFFNSISFTPFGAVLFSQNRGGWDFKNTDPYYYVISDESGKKITFESDGKDFNYKENRTENQIHITSYKYKGLKSLLVKVYDSRTGRLIDNSTVTINIPDNK